MEHIIKEYKNLKSKTKEFANIIWGIYKRRAMEFLKDKHLETMESEKPFLLKDMEINKYGRVSLVGTYGPKGIVRKVDIVDFASFGIKLPDFPLTSDEAKMFLFTKN